MVLTEAFAAGTPVVASDIAGYRDVVRDGVDGLLVPRGDATALAETLRDLALDPEPHRALGAAAAASAERYAWPKVAAQVAEAYADARDVPRPERGARRAAGPHRRHARGPAARAVPPQRLPSLEPAPATGGGAARRPDRRGAAPGRRGARRRGRPVLRARRTSGSTGSATRSSRRARPGCSSAWRSCASRWSSAPSPGTRSSRPRCPTRPRASADAWQGTAVGVLMSATLPARLGEPSRALIVARRLGRPREALPVVLGTLVSQTLLNVLALLILGAVMFSTVGLFAGQEQALIWYALAPVVVLALVLFVPALLRSGLPKRSARLARWIRQARAGATRVRHGLSRLPPPAAGQRGDRRCSSAPGRCSWSAATC